LLLERIERYRHRQAGERSEEGKRGAGDGAVMNVVGWRGGGGLGEQEGGKRSVDGGEQDGEGDVGSDDEDNKGEEDGEDGNDDEELAADDEGDEDEEEEGGEEDDDIDAEIFDWRAKRL
ncbi:unnamed protein product, partial [Closterium sp. NIES-64]